MLKGNYKCYVSEKQFEGLKIALLKEQKHIFLDDYYFNSESIMYILPTSDIQRDDRIKKGDWQCSYGEFHTKGQECGHGIANSYSQKYD